jgi:hypothetical protein
MEINQYSVVRSVWMLMRITYGLVPLVAGLDKFTDMLANWDAYLNPALANMLPLETHSFMMIVGVIEIVAGLLVFVRPAFGGYLVMVWLILIALTLLAWGHYLDVAVRDLAMAVGAFSMARLTAVACRPLVPVSSAKAAL